MRQRLAVLGFVICAGCLPDIRVGPKEGIKPVDGKIDFSFENFECGTPIPVDGFEAVTSKVAGGCQIELQRDVTVVSSSDYERVNDLNGAGNLIKAVELKINKLAFTDTDAGKQVDLATRITDVQLTVNGQRVADKAALLRLPRTVLLTGAALDQVKEQLDSKKPVTIRVAALLTVPLDPPPPKRLHVEFQAQPTLVIGL